MTDNFVAEIRLFPGNFAPHGWAMTNGQLMAISQNTALFSLVGTFYGGNGTSNFALPDFRSRMPINQGQAAGLSSRVIGEEGGAETITLSASRDSRRSAGAHRSCFGRFSTTAADGVAVPRPDFHHRSSRDFSGAELVERMFRASGGGLASAARGVDWYARVRMRYSGMTTDQSRGYFLAAGARTATRRFSSASTTARGIGSSHRCCRQARPISITR